MIYEFLADGFEEVEALCPLDLLRRSGEKIVTVSVKEEGRLVTGAHEIPVKADLSASDAAALLDLGEDKVEMVILPGGMPGTRHLDESPLVERYLARAVEKNAILAAICAAPMILGKRGLLDGKRATCFPGFEEYLKKATVGGRVVTDGRIVTACGMGAALEFGLALVALRSGKDAAEKLAEGVLAK